MESKIVYFSKPGEQNTDEVLRLAKSRADQLGIKTILVASSTGGTAVKAAEVFKGLKLVAVSHQAGFQEPNFQEFTEANRKKVEGSGGMVLAATHVLGGISGAMRRKFSMYSFPEVVAHTLRFFGQGVKVACEISVMAADAGLVRTDEDVISIAGTDRGADVALTLRPVNSLNFFDLKIKEILCKPHF